jgi:ubiquinone biosynthesis protein COQ9
MEPENTTEQAKDRVLAAALAHVPFDGWSEATLTAAIADSGVAPGLARALFPRGGVDLAAAWHRQGDRAMAEALAGQDLTALRFRDRVALAVMLRLQAADRECVRRGSALFALPQHAAEGAGLIWGTADAIWTALGDSSRDVNWYTKRLTLSAVYSATVLYWLGDQSEGHADTWAFLDRRIEDVMRFEKAKADFRASPWGKMLAGPLKRLDAIRAPAAANDDLPGWKGQE